MPDGYMPQCIYCKQADVQFNREHVIPEAFGTFGADTMILESQVCMPCNSKLGGRLDLVLARDSWESRLRGQMLAGQGGRHGHDRFLERRVTMRYEDEGHFPEYRGARFTMDWKRCCPQLMDQILVVDETGVRRSFTLKELPQADTRLFRDRPPGSISIVGTDTAACEALRHAAIQLGARFDSDPAPLNVPEVARHAPALMRIEGFIDEATWLAIAKIAFNYLAYTQPPGYVLHERFDPIRNFITYRLLDRTMVRLLHRPILTDETYAYRAFDGHLVLYHTENRSLRGLVSLYNSLTYEVMLCDDLMLHYRMNSGHAFDLAERRVTPLLISPLRCGR